MPADNADERSTTPPTRIATLVLVSADGNLLGRLPPFPVDTPWWQDAAPAVAGARPGRPPADLAWADAVLARLGRSRSGPAEQNRTWNLSSLWRMPLSDGAAWLKVVPPFFEHEGAVIERLEGDAIPDMLGHDRGRMLFAEIPGSDRYDAARSELLEIVDMLVDVQRRWLGRTGELIDLGLPDWRAPALGRAIADVVERARSTEHAQLHPLSDITRHGYPVDVEPFDLFLNARVP